MTSKPHDPKSSDTKSSNHKSSDPPKVSHPGMMGDGSQEQNLDEVGDPTARIGKDELDATFGKRAPKKP